MLTLSSGFCLIPVEEPPMPEDVHDFKASNTEASLFEALKLLRASPTWRRLSQAVASLGSLLNFGNCWPQGQPD